MKRLITMLAAVAALSLAPTATATAIPGDGAGPDTPGTSASVSPSTLRAGDALSFRVSGFPAGEIINVKIDDGQFCSQSGVHGACVVHQQRIPASGTVTGSLLLPTDLKPGRHWLRFLASQEMTDANGNYLGVKGFTLRGGADFTIIADSSDNGSTKSDGTDDAPATTEDSTPSSNSEGSNTTDAVVAAGTPLVLTLPDGTKKAEQTKKKTDAKPDTPGAETESAELTTPDDVPVAEPVTEATTDPDDGPPFPWLGATVLAVAVVGAGLVLRRGLRSRG